MQRARTRTQKPAAFVALSLLLGGLATGCGNNRPDPKPDPPPQVHVIATGNGELVAAHFGPKGGRLNLGELGPSIDIPEGTAAQGEVSIAMKRDEPFDSSGGSRLGDSFRVTLELNPPSGKMFAVYSAVTASLPAGCTADNLELAVEQPAESGPADGASSPAIEWEYQQARLVGDRIASEVPKFWPHRLQFLCGRAR